jgi:glycerophosphoryl diester phosphodiesterase
VTAYTVNETARAEALFSWGVDAVFTDRPGALLKNFP